MSFGITFTHFMCMVHRFACSSRPTRNTSPASCKAMMAMLWKGKSSLLCNLPNYSLEWKLPDQCISTGLIFLNFPQGFEPSPYSLPLLLFPTTLLPLLSLLSAFPLTYFLLTSHSHFFCFLGIDLSYLFSHHPCQCYLGLTGHL